MFHRWLHSSNPKPYGSYGNGSAMRVSSVGWLYESVEETRHVARLTAEVTHNHPEGIKGAEATASAIFLARNGSTKDEIRKYITTEFGYNLSRTCDEIRPGYYHDETCQKTVPEAITAFLEGETFEDVLRTAVSLGGDCDTLTCISGGIAEAFYGISVSLEIECISRLPDDMNQVIQRFNVARGRSSSNTNEMLDGNTIIENAIAAFHADRNRDTLLAVLESIRIRMHENGQLLIPCITPEPPEELRDLDNIKVGDTITVHEDMHFKLHTIQDSEGKTWFAAFTSEAERDKGASCSIVSDFIDQILKSFKDMSEEGFIINPWGKEFMLSKELINLILDVDKPKNQIFFEIGDITKLKVDAIVNAANPSLLGGGGVDGAIHRAAGPGLLEECRKLNGCNTGEAKITGGYALKAKYVIHTVGPVYKTSDDKCRQLLHDCYYNSLELAKQYDLHTIAFPAISTGVYGYPKEEAAFIALTTVSSWLSENPDYGMAVVISCFDDEMRIIYQNVIDACAPGKENK